MVRHRLLGQLVRSALAVLLLASSAALMPARALAAELSDYLWQRRPLLIFAPTESDPRLGATVRLIEASRCDFADRDMVLGVIVAEGASTLDGRLVGAEQAQRLAARFGIGANNFGVVLIGKDGGEKLRFDDVPDLQAIYAVVDGMPMRGREMSADPDRC